MSESQFHLQNRKICQNLGGHLNAGYFEKDVDRCESVFDSGIDSLKSADFVESIGLDQEGLGDTDKYEATQLSSQINLLSLKDEKGQVKDTDDTELYCTEEDEGYSQEISTSCSITDEIFNQDEDGDTQLHIAIIHQMKELVTKIISTAPSPDYLSIQNDLKQTPLHLAVLTDQPDIVRQLLLAGVNAGQHDSKGNTAVHLACRGGLGQCLVQLTRPITQEEAAHSQYTVALPTVQDVEVLNFEGYNCLHLAGFAGHHAIVQYLINAGADVNTQDGKSGRTLLHHAVESNDHSLVAYLCENGCLDLDKPTWDSGCTALQLAVGRGFTDIASQLIQSGADNSNVTMQESDDSSESYEEQEEEQMYDDFTIGGMPL